MKFDKKTAARANSFRRKVQYETRDIDDAESVTLLLWWTFICDHARCHNLDPKALAREQLEAFLDEAADTISIVRQH